MMFRSSSGPPPRGLPHGLIHKFPLHPALHPPPLGLCGFTVRGADRPERLSLVLKHPPDNHQVRLCPGSAFYRISE